MSDWSTIYSFVLSNEDYTPPRYAVESDPTRDDHAAQAISGINSAAFPELFASISGVVQANRAPAVESAYRQILWNEWIAQVTSDDVAAHVADAEFNEGAGTGVKLLQRAVNGFQAAQIATDGVWGPATVAAVNALPATALRQTFTQLRIAAYQAIKGVAPQTLAEWTARAEKPLPG